MDPRRLLVLRELAARGSVAAAAKALSLTPSAVSQQLNALERELGAQLLEPYGRGVRLTDAGRTLIPHAEAIRVALTRARVDLQAVQSAQAGSLTVGAFPTSGVRLVPAALDRFVTAQPHVSISLIELEPEESLPMVQHGELDVAVAFECDLVPVATSHYEHETLIEEPMLLVHADERAAQGRMPIARLSAQRWIAPMPGTAIHEFTRRACQAAGFEPQITSTWTDFQVVQSLAGHGIGVAFAPALALSPPRAGVAVSPTRPSYARRVFAAWRAGTSREPVIAGLLAELRAAAQTIEPAFR